MGVEGPLSELIEELQNKLKEEDLTALIDASKDDGIDEKELRNLSSTSQWFQWLSDKLLITIGRLRFVKVDRVFVSLQENAESHNYLVHNMSNLCGL